MRWSWKIGEIAGIGIFIHATFFLLILFILLRHVLGGQGLSAALAGIAFILVIFACVVLHELGHALAARRFGIRTRDITLLPIGGVARLERMPEKPSQELRVALAGPVVNVVIAAGLYGVLVLLGSRPELEKLQWVGGDFLNKVMAVNLWLAGFNMLPAFPMDGGRVLRALLASRMEFTRATHIAARVGQAMALLFGLLGLFTNPFLLFIALFVWMGAEQEAAMVQVKTSLGGIPVAQAMLTDFRTVQPEDPLSIAVDHILAGWQQDFPVVFGEHVLGLLTREDLLRMLAQQGTEVRVRDAMRRDFTTVDSHAMLEEALALLQTCECRTIVVLHDGRLVGMLTPDNIAELIAIESALLTHARQSKPETRARQG
jgi:Zn-dependent protease/predicted transcriptional regulator